jgi:hypothetical protein
MGNCCKPTNISVQCHHYDGRTNLIIIGPLPQSTSTTYIYARAREEVGSTDLSLISSKNRSPFLENKLLTLWHYNDWCTPGGILHLDISMNTTGPGASYSDVDGLV